MSAVAGADQPALRDQPCTCGHPRSMHGKRPSRCMAMSSPSTFWDDCEEFTPARSEADSLRDRLVEAMPREWSTYLIRQRMADALLPLIERAKAEAAVEALEQAADALDTRAVQLWRAYKSGPIDDPRRASPHTEGESDGWENAATHVRARAASLRAGAGPC